MAKGENRDRGNMNKKKPSLSIKEKKAKKRAKKK